MCVVSFFKTEQGFFFTSNRDEKNNRPTIHPKIYTHKNQRFIYPKDVEKGGTWFALDSHKKKVACLLNATGTQPDSVKKTSRGKVPIEYLIDEKIILSERFLHQTAPFTLICIQFKNTFFLEEYNWNGQKLTLKVLDENAPHLWCSNTLYSLAEKERLGSLFASQVQGLTTTKKTIDFHKSIAQNANNNVFIKKDNTLQTVSVTCLYGRKIGETITYENLINCSTNTLTTTS